MVFNKGIRVLILTSQPYGVGKTHFDIECNKIKAVLGRSDNQRSFDIFDKNGVTYEGFRDAITGKEHQIIHFITHGETPGLVIEHNCDESLSRNKSFLNTEEIVNILSGALNLQCFFINSCMSADIAEAIHKQFPSVCVIGNAGSADSQCAIEFSKLFYQELSNGRSYQTAFDEAERSYRKECPTGDYEPRIFCSNVIGLNPLLSYRKIPGELAKKLPTSDCVFPTIVTHGDQHFRFEEFSTWILNDIMFSNEAKPVFITGDAGSGKTTIIAKFFEYVKNKSPLLYLRVANDFKYNGATINNNAKDQKNSLYEPLLNESLGAASLDDAIVIVDGFNELQKIENGIGYMYADSYLESDIARLTRRCNQKIIVTSRFIPSTFADDFSIYEVQTLDRDFVEQHLKQYESALTLRGISWGDCSSAMAHYIFGRTHAKLALTTLYYQHEPPSLDTFRELLLQSYGKGDYQKTVSLAKITDDISMKIVYLSAAADRGNADAQFDLGCLYLDFAAQEKDKTSADITKQKAVRLLETSAEGGNIHAATLLGRIYNNEKVLYDLGVEKYDFSAITRDKEKAIDYYLKAAKFGDAEAQFWLGKMYMLDEEIKSNSNAEYWLSLAVKQNHAEAMLQLARLYASKNQISFFHYGEAIKLYDQIISSFKDSMDEHKKNAYFAAKKEKEIFEKHNFWHQDKYTKKNSIDPE